MRLATFNVENMFERPEAMNLDTWAQGKPILDHFSKLNDLIARGTYTAKVKADMLAIMDQYPGLKTNGTSKYIRLREIRGKLTAKPKGKAVQIGVNGRADWVGWFELEKGPVKQEAIHNTARVIREVNADVLCVVEVESRPALMHFNDSVIPDMGGTKYGHVMLIDGNDERGIDVGILTRPALPIQTIASHVDDTDASGIIFSRDCAEYYIPVSGGQTLLVMVNHLKSKGFGSPAASNAKRERQAKRVREIYEKRLLEGHKLIAIAGDFNETPNGAPLQPLLGGQSAPRDIMTHPKFSEPNGRPGTFGNGTQSEKFDYILLSPDLWGKVAAGGIERRGLWAGKNGTIFTHFPEVKGPTDAASDHAAVWADLNI